MVRQSLTRAVVNALAVAIAIAFASDAEAQTRYAPETTPPARSSAQGPNRPVSHTAPITGAESLDAKAAGARPSQGGKDGRLAISSGGDAKAQRAGTSAERAAAAQPNGATQLVGVFGSLAIVLGLFLLVAWVMRRSLPTSSKRLPSEVVEVLGHAPLGHRQQAQLVRLGSKLVLISTAAGGAEPLSEVTDADEVERLTALCRQASPPAAAVTFRQVMRQLGQKRAAGNERRNAATPRQLKSETEVGRG
ncbi:MAG: flagellar biosynthetic protein FliO [Planctomycetia bacterium]|nr:flagellar biosynthetic protein FliO [Planctomycetia bacterium]